MAVRSIQCLGRVLALALLGAGCALPTPAAPTDGGADGPADGPADASGGEDKKRTDSGRDLGLGDLVLDDAGCVVTVHRVAAAGDEGEIDGDVHLPDGQGTSGVYMGYYQGNVTWGYFRFTLENDLPPDVRIDSARVAILGSGLQDWDTQVHALSVAAEDSPDAKQVRFGTDRPDDPEGRGRPLTAARVRWPNTDKGLNWQAGELNRSPNLGPVIEELVSHHGGLAAGQHIQLWIGAAFDDDSAEVVTPSFNSAKYRSPELSIKLCP